jgi:hypothetical protein
MTFEQFMSQMLKPTYVWRMASGLVGMQARQHGEAPLVRSARTRMANARRRIDDLVLERAAVIADERRCAAVSFKVTEEKGGKPIEEGGGTTHPVRCEYQRGHGKVLGRERTSTGQLDIHGREWDHGAPSAKVWWNE